MFVGRKRELEKLNKMYHSSQFEFAVLYGRRRVGEYSCAAGSSVIIRFLPSYITGYIV